MTRVAQKLPPRRRSSLSGKKKLDEQRNQLQKTERTCRHSVSSRSVSKLYDFTSGYRMVSEDQSTARLRLSCFKKKIYEVPSAELQKVVSDMWSANRTGTAQFDVNLSESALGGGSHR